MRARYAAFEAGQYGSAWTTEELALGFVGDVGDLAKLIQAHAGRRVIPDTPAKLAHEFGDCLWSILVLADACGVDLAAAFGQTMDDLEAYLP